MSTHSSMECMPRSLSVLATARTSSRAMPLPWRSFRLFQDVYGVQFSFVDSVLRVCWTAAREAHDLLCSFILGYIGEGAIRRVADSPLPDVCSGFVGEVVKVVVGHDAAIGGAPCVYVDAGDLWGVGGGGCSDNHCPSRKGAIYRAPTSTNPESAWVCAPPSRLRFRERLSCPGQCPRLLR